MILGIQRSVSIDQAGLRDVTAPFFSHAWEQRKLRDYLVPSKEKNSALSYGKDEVLSVSGDAGVVNQIQFQGRSYAGASTKDYGVVQTGDVIYTKSPLKKNPFGIIKTNEGKAGIVSTLYAVYKPKDNTYTPFVEVYFDDDARLNNYLRPLVNKGAKNDMKVSKSGALTGLICFPGATEQRMLSEFFQQLEDLITLHQRKLSHLRQLKKGLLQKMFPKSGEDRPEVRFPGFADAWEQRKLGSVIEERNIQQAQSRKYPLVSFTVEQGVTPKTKRYEREQLVVGDKASKKYKITEYNDIVYNPANLKFGAISRNTYGNAVFSPIYVTFVVDLEVASPSFIGLFVTRQDFIQRSLMYQQGTVYERQSVNPEDLLSMNCYLPSRPEQESISLLFGQLDDLITLHQRKLSHLRELKRGLLQKMFPKSGEDRPEVRFPGFADAWEQRKLGELENDGRIRLGRGHVISAKDVQQCPGQYPIYSASAKHGGEMGQYGHYMFDQELVTWSIDGGGSVFYRPKHKYSVTNVCGFIDANSSIDTAFLAYQMGLRHSRLHFDYTVKAHPSVIRNLYYIGIPSLPEQRCISSLFGQLDNLITLHQRKQLNI